MRETTQLSFRGEVMENPASSLWSHSVAQGLAWDWDGATQPGSGQEGRGGALLLLHLLLSTRLEGQRRAHTDTGHIHPPLQW